MSDSGSTRKVSNRLVALSSAAILAVYGAGYARTRAAADRFTDRPQDRRPHIPLRSASAAPVSREVQQPAPAAPQTPVARLTAPAANTTEADVAPKRARRAAVPDREETKVVRAGAATPAVPPPAAPAAASPTAAIVSTPVPVADVEANSASTATPSAPSAPAASAVATTTPATSKYRDGTYLGWGTSRHGDIQVAVSVEAGRITAARVAQCLTRYSCSWIDPIPPVILRQQGPTYDYVSGATESSDAFQTAVADALSHAS